MIILGSQEHQPDNSANTGTSPQEWGKSYDHAKNVTVPLGELADRHARGAEKMLALTTYDGSYMDSPQFVQLAERYAQKSKSAVRTAHEIGHITAVQLGIEDTDVDGLKELVGSDTAKR